MNSFTFIRRGIDAAVREQVAAYERGEELEQSTYDYDPDTDKLTVHRSKEEADDYRYFPEPDLLPIEPDPALIARLKSELPEAPAVRRRRLKDEWGFTDNEFQDVANSGLLVEIAETVAAGATPQAARKWWTGEIARLANAQDADAASIITPQQVAELDALVNDGTLTDRLARQVIEGVIAGEGTPAEVVEKRGLKVVSDDGALIAAIDTALAAQPDVLEKIRDGKVQAAGAVIGAVMKAMKGQADAARVRELVLERATSA
jgi:aspartyl-tRNA(Asn)/glutamyl-tRNA(Gln) amidotransferase subunit B